MKIRTIAELKAFENQHFRNYEIMPNYAVDGLDQIKIPGDNNCCFNAILVGAKNLNLNIPMNINNHFDLRQRTADFCLNKVAISRSILEFGDEPLNADHHKQYLEAHEFITGKIPSVIEEYNKRFKTHVRTIEQYVEHMRIIDTWGATFELILMSEILNCNIINHTSFRYPVVISQPTAIHTIHIKHSGNHYNLLVPTNSWQGIAADDPIRELDKNLHNYRALYFKDKKHFNWTSLHRAVFDGNYNEVQRLVEMGVEIVKDSRGLFPHQIEINPKFKDNLDYLSSRLKCELFLKPRTVDNTKTIALLSESTTQPVLFEENEYDQEEEKRASTPRPPSFSLRQHNNDNNGSQNNFYFKFNP